MGFWTQWKKVRVGWFERIALKHVYYHMWNRSPVQIWCMRQGAQVWCTGMNLRNGMGKEVGGGFTMGNTCTPMAYSCQCMQKPPQYCKVISFQLKQINYFILLFFFNFYFYFVLLYNTVLVLPYIDMNPPRVYMHSQTWTPPPTSLPITSLLAIPVHQPQACCILHRT